MIKGNESDVTNIDFDLHTKRGDKFLYFTYFRNLKRLSVVSASRYLIVMRFKSKCGIFNGQVVYIENSELNIANMWVILLDHVTYNDTLK